MLETIFQAIGGYSQLEHGVDFIKVCLNEGQLNIKFLDLECLNLENICINATS